MAASIVGASDEASVRSLIVSQTNQTVLFFQVTLYAVTPLTWCLHLSEVHPVPDGGLNVDAPCDDCGDVKECWVCLHCYKVYLQ